MTRVKVTHLSPLQRGYLIGVRRTRLKAKAEFARQAADYDAELVALRDEFYELALAHHRQCYDAAISEAMLQRAADPNMLTH